MRISEKTTKHGILHYFFMVIYEEFLNIIWIFVGIILALGGYVLFKFSKISFFEIAIGVPLALSGLSVIIFKTYEIFLTILSPTRLKAICVFCNDNAK